MNRINLSDFAGADCRERFAAALGYMKEHPGTTLYVEPGVYTVTTDLARQAQKSVMDGGFGADPEPVMFAVGYKYDRGLDFAGHRGSRIEAYGVTLMIDGFMEPISIRDCSDVEICGLTVDHLRKPYSHGKILSAEGDGEEKRVTLEFSEEFPITENMPAIRPLIYDHRAGRFVRFINLGETQVEDGRYLIFNSREIGAEDVGCDVYLRHTAHSRPAILIHNAGNTVLRDVTIHSAPGMGITAQQASDILIERLRVVPSAGEHMSTNTDATHFASCRGKLRLDGCEFDGQGDDSINVHTYYYIIEEHDGARAKLAIHSPDGPHARLLDYPLVGDTVELTEASTLHPVETYRVLSVTPDFENFCCFVELDRPLPENLDGLYLADADEVPELEFVNCHARNHFARSILIKCRRALVENCTVSDSFLDAVKIAAEAYWQEGISTEEVTVRRCRFINCSRFDGECGGIHVYMDCDDKSALSHGTVIIEDNIISCPEADHAIIVENARRVKLRRNQTLSRKEEILIGDGVEII